MSRHPLDPVCLISGIVFTGLGLAFLNTDFDVADLTGKVGVPMLLLLIGLVFAGLGLARTTKNPRPGPDSEGGEPEI